MSDCVFDILKHFGQTNNYYEIGWLLQLLWTKWGKERVSQGFEFPVEGPESLPWKKHLPPVAAELKPPKSKSWPHPVSDWFTTQSELPDCRVPAVTLRAWVKKERVPEDWSGDLWNDADEAGDVEPPKSSWVFFASRRNYVTHIWKD